MCGVAGLVCRDPGCSGITHERTVRRLTGLQHHRGPDDHGVESFARVCLGSRRLSILDLSPGGHMPMGDPTGRWWISYNGEVYNYRDLRRELESAGHEFRSGTDTEVVLHSFIEWGEAAMDRFVGMFAFAVFDCVSGNVTLARDRFGIKPLYFADDGRHVLFASEIRALVSVTGLEEPDSGRLVEWLLYRNVEAFHSGGLIRGIRAVMPGQVVVLGPRDTHTRQVYRLTAQVSAGEYERLDSLSDQEVVDELDRSTSEAIVARLVSDVPVGTLLSGGLDSSLVTAIAGRHAGLFKAFHVSVEGDDALDERPYAEELARRLDLELVIYSLTPRAFRQELPAVIESSDLPPSHPNSVAYSLISRVAREHGVVVLLCGEGADELFGGYAFNYRRRLFLERLRPLLRSVPKPLYDALALIVYAREDLPVTSRGFRRLLPPAVAFVDRYARRSWQLECERAYDFVSRRPERVVLASMLADITDFLSPLLRRLDRMSMMHSVEARVPFLDHRVVHTVINLPLRYRLRGYVDKWVLRKVAERHIPRLVARRRKRGFPLPLDAYLAPFAQRRFFEGGYLEDGLGIPWPAIETVAAARGENAIVFFGLVALEMWGRLFCRGESRSELEDLVETVEPSSHALALVEGRRVS